MDPSWVYTYPRVPFLEPFLRRLLADSTAAESLAAGDTADSEQPYFSPEKLVVNLWLIGEDLGVS